MSDTAIVRYGLPDRQEYLLVEINIEENARQMRAYGSTHPLDIRILTQNLAGLMNSPSPYARYFVCRSTDGRTVVIPKEHVLSIEENPHG